ncbi:MAG: MopE-related protein [Deltaproteobacteria bacterium]|nr:MopE-related protein [Deltaproteobacteria bacterium]
MKSFSGVFTGALLLLLVLLSSLSEAAVPGTLTYQGRLTNSSGLAITGQVDITFNIYSVPTGGAPLWTQTIAGVTVVNGIFTATLGTVVNPINSSVISGADVYIGVKVGTDVEMMPRQKFAAVPYSVKASEADTVVDGAITAAKLANICSTGEVLVKSGSTWTCAMPSVLASCYNGDFVSCYGADPSTIGVGPCRSGIRTCNGNSFSAACLGEVTPVTETCDGTDEDCNGVVDDAPGAPTWYGDADNDTFGNAAKPLVKCTQPAGYVSNSTDCGDTNEFVNPVRPEICDGLDNDCNSQIDDSCVTAACTGDEQSQVFECGAMCGGSDMMCIADCLNSMGLTAECHGSVTTLGMCVFNVGDPACLTNMTCWRQTCSAEYGAAFGPECKSGVTRSCGPGTEVGACQSGTETCVSGFWSGVCAGAVYQSADMCDGLDNNCNGITDETPDTICGLGGSCVSGACQCFGGFTACSSQCVNTDDDMFNCGACGNDCLAAVPDGADTFCSSGTCQYMCMGGRDDCNGTMADGCETDLWFDTANCGACGNDCASQVGANATPACDGAMCRAVCNSGFEDCNGDPVDGCEADLLSDPNNCGWCNNTADDGDMCNGAETCVSGTVSSGAPLSCDDGVSCTADFCQSFVGCEHVTQDFMCDDGNVCTSDYCDVSNGCMGAPFDAPIGDVCSTGLPGVCADGATACSGGATTCVQNNLPSAEVCDGSDNDCDGQSDEGGVCAVCGDGIVSVSEQCDDGIRCRATDARVLVWRNPVISA